MLPEREVTRMPSFDKDDRLPTVRDGLTHKERTILHCLHEAQRELGDRKVPTIMLYGRVVEHVDIGQDEFQYLLNRLIGPERGSHLRD